jgi:transposase
VGTINRAGDPAVRLAVFEAAHVIMTRVAKWSALKSWAVRVAQRRGAKRSKVALALQTCCGAAPDVGFRNRFPLRRRQGGMIG